MQMILIAVLVENSALINVATFDFWNKIAIPLHIIALAFKYYGYSLVLKLWVLVSNPYCFNFSLSTKGLFF